MTRQHYGDHIRRTQSDWRRENGGNHRRPDDLDNAPPIKLVPLAEHKKQHSFPKMADAAFIGLAGAIVHLIEPHTESDSVALLLNLHAAFGNAIGRGPYYQVEGDRHGTNLFVLQVGDTAKARKGTGVGRIRQLFRLFDPEWDAGRVRNALSSGEGLIWEVRDPITKTKDGVEETTDAGISDKRLMVFASEFASLLNVMQREGNILSAVLRDAWDRGDLNIVTKHNPARATGALISLVGHITRDELVKHLHETEMASGFANRFLFACVRRSKLLPHGGELDEQTVAEMAKRVKAAVAFAKEANRIGFSIDGGVRWQEVYATLSADCPGLLGALTARAEAQVVRLALLYALWDQSYTITLQHLTAALAVWDYCHASVEHLFGDKLGDAGADAILSALRHTPEGLSRTAISGLFSRNVAANKIARALEELERRGLANCRNNTANGPGRPSETWFATKRG